MQFTKFKTGIKESLLKMSILWKFKSILAFSNHFDKKIITCHHGLTKNQYNYLRQTDHTDKDSFLNDDLKSERIMT